jgi:RNA polymerase sigma-70 factor (ECF subfamily)
MLRDSAAAEDVVQESFLNVWRSARQFNPQRGIVRAWLLTAVRHRSLDALRSRSPLASQDAPIDATGEMAGSDDVVGTVLAGFEAHDVQQALAALPEEQRKTVRLAYLAGLSHGQIAAQQEVPLGTVKGRLRLATQHLRELLAASAEREGAG